MLYINWKMIRNVIVLLVGVDGGCFLVAGGAASSESELELLDDAAFRFKSALTDCTVGVGFEFVDGFRTSSSEESDEDDESCFFLFPFVYGATFCAGVVTFF